MLLPWHVKWPYFSFKITFNVFLVLYCGWNISIWDLQMIALLLFSLYTTSQFFWHRGCYWILCSWQIYTISQPKHNNNYKLLDKLKKGDVNCSCILISSTFFALLKPLIAHFYTRKLAFSVNPIKTIMHHFSGEQLPITDVLFLSKGAKKNAPICKLSGFFHILNSFGWNLN